MGAPLPAQNAQKADSMGKKQYQGNKVLNYFTRGWGKSKPGEAPGDNEMRGHQVK
jgi:hypothetical protein